MAKMRNSAHDQSQVKVAVYAAQASSPDLQRQRLQEIFAFTLIGLSALIAFWIS